MNIININMSERQDRSSLKRKFFSMLLVTELVSEYCMFYIVFINYICSLIIEALQWGRCVIFFSRLLLDIHKYMYVQQRRPRLFCYVLRLMWSQYRSCWAWLLASGWREPLDWCSIYKSRKIQQNLLKITTYEGLHKFKQYRIRFCTTAQGLFFSKAPLFIFIRI